ncbi:MAG TPA: alpha/beta fold hydrolase [Sandaracinaceae bacterium LLY-WYZ-13_1]|nr:alpha/beta fold hydrolase [Sandaracinaceae bacterium LLY-WYZ-13_1]
MDEPSTSEHFAHTDDGWRLQLTRTAHRGRVDPARRPVVIVPGYGMNGFIFGFHPRGTSLVRHLADAGLEVWVANLRGQGASAPRSPDAPGPSLRAYAEQDLRAAIDAVLGHTEGRADAVDVLGASLGGSIAYAHLALERDARIGALVTVGSPLRWTDVPLLLRVPFRSPRLASLVRVRGTRRLAGLALPVATRVPALLSLYMNTANVDLDHAEVMVRTVEDPHPRVNADIAKWLNASDMVLRGVNVTEALAGRREPLLVVLANRDGIVPEGAALSVRDAWGGGDVETLRIGDDEGWYAHADLFVGDEAPARVFEPIRRWLAERSG